MSKKQSIRIEYLLIILAVALIAYGLWGILYKPSITPQPITVNSSSLTAAIVDGLSNDIPNPQLIRKLENMLRESGYQVDVYNADDITVDMMGRILCSDYDIVIMRIHGGRTFSTEGKDLGLVSFFTSEPYTPDKYQELQARGLVGKGKPVYNPENEVFVVTPLFVDSLECGSAPKLLIVASCYSMYGTSMAEAVIDHGVEAYIGWNGLVDAASNDKALEIVVQDLLNGGTISEAVLSTYNLTTQSKLLYYPLEAGSMTLQGIVGGQ